MRKTSVTTIALLLVSCALYADNLYVTGKGNDDNNGKTEATAFRTLQKAANIVQPGDVVLIGDGIYTSDDKSNGSAVLNITRSGKEGAWITWKALPGQHPQLKPSGWHGVRLTGSYQIIDGLTITGNNDALVLTDALSDAKNQIPNPMYNTNGISIDGRAKGPAEKPHHFIFRNCVIGKCPGGGITGIETDYVTIEDCKVFNNCWYMRYAGSGITMLDNWTFDNAPGYHVIIQRNYVWNNKTLVPWEKIGKLSDGNGILQDVTDQEKVNGATNPNGDAVIKPAQPVTVKAPRPEWTSKELIANNLSAFNGGSGIHTFRTRNVDIINNTTYWNGQTVGYPELFANASENITMLNNIMVPRPEGKVTANSRNTDIHWDYNLYPIDQNVVRGPNDIIADPQFKMVEADLLKSNFRVTKNSPALHSGTKELAQPTDINGKKRLKNTTPDRGAFAQ